MKQFASGFVFATALLYGALAQAVQVPAPLVETAWVTEHLQDVMIMDVRGDAKSFTRPPGYATHPQTRQRVLTRIGGHVPGAVLVSFKEARSKRTIGGQVVDKMLPARGDFEQLMRKAGANQDSAIVLVTEGMGSGDMTIAARLYWQLKYFGHDNVAILNGGLLQWLFEGRPVDTQASRPAAGNWQARAERNEILASSDDVAKAMATGSAQLMDNRSIAQYVGTSKRPYVYAKGHIPGAKMFPNEIMVQGDGAAKFLPVEDLRQLVSSFGLDPEASTISYCNSGHLASGGWFIMHELLGNKNVKLYDGSMHQWTLEKRPVRAMTVD